ncbi:putative glycine-rich cell wall structural protein 1 [Arachis ipaensis]|uniref:putative glycine-rich cell wall structural protein 1 n=1 Tax=Arachis ipaensis TaxID=130454 RepID=UPI0007AF1FC5|nr:putative glycine-rich cell wall structural protein 1 [Arachis ipaensis]
MWTANQRDNGSGGDGVDNGDDDNGHGGGGSGHDTSDGDGGGGGGNGGMRGGAGGGGVGAGGCGHSGFVGGVSGVASGGGGGGGFGGHSRDGDRCGGYGGVGYDSNGGGSFSIVNELPSGLIDETFSLGGTPPSAFAITTAAQPRPLTSQEYRSDDMEHDGDKDDDDVPVAQRAWRIRPPNCCSTGSHLF